MFDMGPHFSGIISRGLDGQNDAFSASCRGGTCGTFGSAHQFEASVNERIFENSRGGVYRGIETITFHASGESFAGEGFGFCAGIINERESMPVAFEIAGASVVEEVEDIFARLADFGKVHGCSGRGR